MWLLKILIAFPVLAFFVVFLVQNNELVTLWPFTGMDWFPVEKVGTSVVYFILFSLGWFIGRLSAWSAYAPLRATLRQQKKENKVLSKEHEKLNHEHEKLNQQYTNLQEEADKSGIRSGFSLNKKIKGWFAGSSDED
jgi:cell division protein FtsB